MKKSCIILFQLMVILLVPSTIVSKSVKWRFKTYGCVEGSSLGQDGSIYSGTSEGYLYALNSNGKLMWTYLTGDEIYACLTIDSYGTVYFGSCDHYLYAIDESGKLKWRYETGDYIFSSPAVDNNGNVYFGASDCYFYVLRSNGTRKWRYKTKDAILSSPAIASDGSIYFGSTDGYLYALRSSGTLKWRYKTGGQIRSSPAIGADGVIYLGSWDNYFYAFTSNGTLKWRYKTNSVITSSPAIGPDGSIYFGSDDGYLYALNPTGSLKWRYHVDHPVMSSPIVGSDSTIYFCSGDYLYAIKPDGRLDWRHKIGWRTIPQPTPTIDPNGTLYIGSGFPEYDSLGEYIGDRGYLYAIQTDSRGLANSPWPKFGHDNQNTGRAQKQVIASTQVTVPYVQNSNLNDALRRLAELGLYSNVEFIYSNTVAKHEIISLSPSPGTKVEKESYVEVRTSLGPEIKESEPVLSTPLSSERPELSFSVTASDSDKDGLFEGGETVSLTVRVTNKGEGSAKNVTVNLSGSQDLLKHIGSSKQINSINPDETKIVIFSSFLPYDVEAQNLSVRVSLSESKLGKIPQEKLLQIAMAPAQTTVEREVISKIVDVDQVPAKRTSNEKAYAVVIGIEEYREETVPSVPYARSDAEKVRDYLINVVGIRADRIFTLFDDNATFVDIAEVIEDKLPMAVDEQSFLFIYFAGHGTHDDAGNSYLIPYNGKPSSTRSLYSLDDLNTALAKLPTENVVVALDACFSGGGRSAVAQGTRPAVMAKLPDFKHVTLAAAQANQTANAYDAAEHGLFTYYLLKALKGEADTDSDGWVELGELYEYISDNVSKTASRVLFKNQNPTVIPDNLGGKEDFRIGKAK